MNADAGAVDAMERHGLTDKQLAIIVFITDRLLADGYQPTVREIGVEFAIRSPNGVMCHLKALEKKGFLFIGQRRSRCLLVRRWPDGSPFHGMVRAPAPEFDPTPTDDIEAILAARSDGNMDHLKPVSGCEHRPDFGRGPDHPQCMASSDGDCYWRHCPAGAVSGRSCPLTSPRRTR